MNLLNITREHLAQCMVAIALVAGVSTVLQPVSVGAIDVFDCTGANAKTDLCAASNNDSARILIRNITNTLIFLIGAIAVIMIVIGGFRYVTSNGEASNVQSAKNTILYSVIGLVVAILSYGIVTFVIDRF